MDQQQLINQFKELTKTSDSDSRFYLESHNWDIEEAMASYFENPQSTPTTSNKPSTSTQPTSSSTSTSSSSASSSSSSSAPKPSKSGNRGIKGFSDFNKGDGEDEDADDNVNWFTGGEKSGLQVQAPKSQKKANLVDEVIDAAKEGGAKEKEHYEEQNKPFTGSGFRLGQQVNTPSQQVSTQKKEERKKIVLYKQGFTYDNGPLRDYNDPANIAFLNDIKQGRMPAEIRNEGNDILVELSDQRSEDYKAPPMPAFSGSGNRLGSAPSTTTTTTTTSSNNSNSSSTPGPNPIKLDESQPTTSVQIRCSDGSRLVGKFNQNTHTVSDIRRYVDSQKGNKNYDLFFSFPQKLISDESQTISAAGLVNSVVIQKMK